MILEIIKKVRYYHQKAVEHEAIKEQSGSYT